MISEMVLHKSISFGLLKEIANQCSSFGSDITLIKGNLSADAKNVLNLVTLSLHPQDKISIIVEGEDAEFASKKVSQLLN